MIRKKDKPTYSQTDAVRLHPHEDEEIGRYEDPAQEFRQESPEEFLNYNIEQKRMAFEAAAASMDTETVLDVIAAALSAQTFATSNSHLEIGVAGALLNAALFSYFSVRYEKRHNYEEYVTARAIRVVAEEDNGIDARHLLPIFAMQFDRHPEETNWWENISYYKPTVSIGDIPLEYAELIEQAREHIRQEDKIEWQLGQNLVVRTAQNLGSDFLRAGKSLTKDFRSSAREVRDSTKAIKTLLQKRKELGTIRRAETWFEQKEQDRDLYAAVAAFNEEDPELAKKKSEEIRARSLEKYFTSRYLALRRGQSEQTKELRENVGQQVFTASGVTAANTFMATNLTLGGMSLGNALMNYLSQAPQGSVGMQLASGLAYLGLAYMNIPPARTLYNSLHRLHTRFKETGTQILEEQGRVREELSNIVEIVHNYRSGLYVAQDHSDPQI